MSRCPDSHCIQSAKKPMYFSICNHVSTKHDVMHVTYMKKWIETYNIILIDVHKLHETLNKILI